MIQINHFACCSQQICPMVGPSQTIRHKQRDPILNYYDFTPTTQKLPCSDRRFIAESHHLTRKVVKDHCLQQLWQREKISGGKVYLLKITPIHTPPLLMNWSSCQLHNFLNSLVSNIDTTVRQPQHSTSTKNPMISFLYNC